MLTCNAHALTPEERQRQRNIWQALLRTSRKVAIPDGYSFEFLPLELSLGRVAELMDLERKCCGFAVLELRVSSDGTASFSFRGPESTRAVLDAQLEVFTRSE